MKVKINQQLMYNRQSTAHILSTDFLLLACRVSDQTLNDCNEYSFPIFKTTIFAASLCDRHKELLQGCREVLHRGLHRAEVFA